MNTGTLSDEDARLREIAEIAADLFTVTPEEVVTAESFIDDLGTDSLLAIELLCQLEKHFGMRIEEDASSRMTNLRNTYDVVSEIAGW